MQYDERCSMTRVVVMHETASGYYELKPGEDDTVVTVDGLVSPLITLQYGTVSRLKWIEFRFFFFWNRLVQHCDNSTQECKSSMLIG